MNAESRAVFTKLYSSFKDTASCKSCTPIAPSMSKPTMQPCSPANYDLIMQNKANLLDIQMNISYFFTMNYEQITMNNEPIKQTQSNPIFCSLLSWVCGLESVVFRIYNRSLWKNKPRYFGAAGSDN